MWKYLTSSIVLLTAWTLCHCSRERESIFVAVERTVDDLISDLSVSDEDFFAKYNVDKINDEVKKLNKILHRMKSDGTQANEQKMNNIPTSFDRVKKRTHTGPPKMIFKGKRTDMKDPKSSETLSQSTKKSLLEDGASKEILINEIDDLIASTSKSIQPENNDKTDTVIEKSDEILPPLNKTPKPSYDWLHAALKKVLTTESQNKDFFTIRQDGNGNLQKDIEKRTGGLDSTSGEAKTQKRKKLTNFLITFIQNHKKDSSTV